MTKRWYLDPTAMTVILVVNGYAVTAIFSVWLGLDESSTLAILVRILTLALCLRLMASGIKFERLDSFLILLWLIYTTRLVYDAFDPLILGTQTAILFFALTAVFPAIALTTTKIDWNERNLVIGLIITGVFICSGALWGMKALPAGQDYLFATGRLGFEKLDPISTGHIGCTTTIAALILSTGSNRWTTRLVSAFAIGLGLAVMILAASRGALIAFAACSLILSIRQRLWKHLAVAVVLALASLALIDIQALLESTRIAGTGQDDSSLERKYVLALALKLIVENWEFGSSYTLPGDLGYPHNIIIESWMAMGLLGFLLMLYITSRGVIAAIVKAETDKPMIPMLYLQFLVGAQFSGSFYGWSGMWMGLAILLSDRTARARGDLPAPEQSPQPQRLTPPHPA